MKCAKVGDSVKVHYTGKFTSGEQFDSSVGGEPLEIVLGEGAVIPGFEYAVIGMQVGEKKSVEVSPEDGYGQRNEELVVTVPRSALPQDVDPVPGMVLQVQSPDAEGAANVLVTDVSVDTITIDGNHPLAGESLIFEVELVALV